MADFCFANFICTFTIIEFSEVSFICNHKMVLSTKLKLIKLLIMILPAILYYIQNKINDDDFIEFIKKLIQEIFPILVFRRDHIDKWKSHYSTLKVYFEEKYRQFISVFLCGVGVAVSFWVLKMKEHEESGSMLGLHVLTMYNS